MFVVGIESLSMEHGIDGVDTLKVAAEDDICLQLIRQHRDDLW